MFQTKLRNVDLLSQSFKAFSLYEFEMLSTPSRRTGSVMDEPLQEQDNGLQACSGDEVSYRSILRGQPGLESQKL